LLVPRDDEQGADQTEDQEGNDDTTEDLAAATEPQGNIAQNEIDQASTDPNRQDQTTISVTEKASPHVQSSSIVNGTKEKDHSLERSSRLASRKSSLNAVGDTNLAQEQNGM
jgi:hypothetical protein